MQKEKERKRKKKEKTVKERKRQQEKRKALGQLLLKLEIVSLLYMYRYIIMYKLCTYVVLCLLTVLEKELQLTFLLFLSVKLTVKMKGGKKTEEKRHQQEPERQRFYRFPPFF